MKLNSQKETKIVIVFHKISEQFLKFPGKVLVVKQCGIVTLRMCKL